MHCYPSTLSVHCARLQQHVLLNARTEAFINGLHSRAVC
jgi:hypothetical protein